jgi:hypothetical protein
MPETRDRTGLRARIRLLAPLFLGPCLAGCATVAQDVDAYYRQMAVNFREAHDKAKLEETSLENVSRMLLATGDTASYRKTQRRLERTRSWESHCAKEEERFQKAAAWMESHFALEKSAPAKAASSHSDEPETGPSTSPESAPPR